MFVFQDWNLHHIKKLTEKKLFAWNIASMFLSQNYKTEAKISHMCVKQHLRCNWCWRLNHYSEIFRLFLVIQFIVHRVAVGQWSVVCGAVAGYTGQPRARGKRRREHGQKTSWLLLLLKNAPNTPIWLLPLDDS